MAVYFIREKVYKGKVKIGYSQDPEQRLKELQTGNSNTLEIVAQISNGTAQTEKEIQGYFWDKHCCGEWFNISLEEIENICKKYYATGNTENKTTEELVEEFVRQEERLLAEQGQIQKKLSKRHMLADISIMRFTKRLEDIKDALAEVYNKRQDAFYQTEEGKKLAEQYERERVEAERNQERERIAEEYERKRVEAKRNQERVYRKEFVKAYTEELEKGQQTKTLVIVSGWVAIGICPVIGSIFGPGGFFWGLVMSAIIWFMITVFS